MEAQESNEVTCFRNLCESFRKFALSMSFNFVKDLNLDKLPENERAGRISLHIKLAMDEIQAIDRLEYYLNRNEPDKLLELFRNSANMNNRDEMKKLEDIMIQHEIALRLQVMLQEDSLRRQCSCKKNNAYPDLSPGDKALADLCEVLSEIDKDIHLVKAPSTIPELAKMALCHNWSTTKKPIYVACRTTELKCVVDEIKSFNPDFNYANIGRCGLFISKAGNPVTAHDLSSSTTKKEKIKVSIEYALATFRKKY